MGATGSGGSRGSGAGALRVTGQFRPRFFDPQYMHAMSTVDRALELASNQTGRRRQANVRRARRILNAYGQNNTRITSQ